MSLKLLFIFEEEEKVFDEHLEILLVLKYKIGGAHLV